MSKILLCALTLVSFAVSHAGDGGDAASRRSRRPAALPAEPGSGFYVCGSTKRAAHSHCFMTQRLSQKCVECRGWDMAEKDKNAAIAYGVDLGLKCLLCDKLLRERVE